MPTPRTTSRPRRLALAGAVLASSAVAAVPAGAAGVDQSVYDPGVPAGQVQQGAFSVTTTRTKSPVDERIRFAVSEHRWRATTVDAKTQRVIQETAYDGTTTTLYTPQAPARQRLTQLKGAEPPPLPGYTAAYVKHLLARKHVSPGLATTVAGVPGNEYAVPDAPGTLTLVLANDTLAPLVREATAKGFTQREELLRTSTSGTRAARDAVSVGHLHALVEGWKAKARR